jgi:hypothetical protein
MKKIYLFSLGLITAISIFSQCTPEKGPKIDLVKRSGIALDSYYVDATVQIPDNRNVLIEEFSGVRCTNCWTGHDATEAILQNHPGRTVGVTLHVADENIEPLTHPYNFANAQNFQTTESTEIDKLFGTYSGMPTALIDRHTFPPSTKAFQSPPAVWAGLVDGELNGISPVNVTMSNSWNPSTRSIKSRVELHYTSDITDAQYISFMIVEDGIINPQYVSNKIDTFYAKHHNILRKMLTNATGTLITHDTKKGSVPVYVFQIDNIPTLWNADKINLVAFVRR